MKRICGFCGKDSPRLSAFLDFRGNGIGLICDGCYQEAKSLLYRIPGAPPLDENGNPLCSPYHTPSVRNFKHLIALAEARS